MKRFFTNPVPTEDFKSRYVRTLSLIFDELTALNQLEEIFMTASLRDPTFGILDDRRHRFFFYGDFVHGRSVENVLAEANP